MYLVGCGLGGLDFIMGNLDLYGFSVMECVCFFLPFVIVARGFLIDLGGYSGTLHFFLIVYTLYLVRL